MKKKRLGYFIKKNMLTVNVKKQFVKKKIFSPSSRESESGHCKVSQQRLQQRKGRRKKTPPAVPTDGQNIF